MISQPRPTARVVVIGNEILSGKVQDTNSPWLFRQLRRRGVLCTGLVVVSDDVGQIAAAVRSASQAADLVFTSGGVGPTHDDVTMEGVAAAFELPLVEHAGLLHLIETVWKKPPAEAWRRMARVPEGAQVYDTERFPQVQVGNVYVFPGVPRLFRHRFEAIADRFAGPRRACSAIWTQQGEGELAAPLEQVDARFSEVELGSYPQWKREECRVILTLEADDAAVLGDAREALLALLDPDQVVRVIEEHHPEDAD